jgi:ribosomal protein S21
MEKISVMVSQEQILKKKKTREIFETIRTRNRTKTIYAKKMYKLLPLTTKVINP